MGKRQRNRKSVRLKRYDYSRPGAYFITICTRKRKSNLGSVVNGEIALSEYGEIVANSWEWLPKQYPYVLLDEWVVMPNHIHGIIMIASGAVHPSVSDADGSHLGPRRNPTVPIKGEPSTRRKPIGELIGAFKTVSTKSLNEILRTPGARFWHRNYYEHVIRDDEDLHSIRKYILHNPRKWEYDVENSNEISIAEKREFWKTFLNRRQ